MHTVVATTDERGCIVNLQCGDALTEPHEGLTIGEGNGERYRHPRGNYLPGGLKTVDGLPRWKIAPTASLPDRTPFDTFGFGEEKWGIYLRTEEELAEERPAQGESVEGRMVQLEQQAGALEEALDMLLTGVVEDE